MNPSPSAVHDLTDRNVRLIADLERAMVRTATPAARLSTAIARFCGSLLFVSLHLAWFAVWLGLNSAPGIPHPDPYPFTFLTLIVSLEAIFLSSFIMMSQNEASRIIERRSHLDLQINLLSEQENTRMLAMLEAIAHKVGAPTGPSPELAAMKEATRPDRLIEQIERAAKADIAN